MPAAACSSDRGLRLRRSAALVLFLVLISTAMSVLRSAYSGRGLEGSIFAATTTTSGNDGSSSGGGGGGGGVNDDRSSRRGSPGGSGGRGRATGEGRGKRRPPEDSSDPWAGGGGGGGGNRKRGKNKHNSFQPSSKQQGQHQQQQRQQQRQRIGVVQLNPAYDYFWRGRIKNLCSKIERRLNTIKLLALEEEGGRLARGNNGRGGRNAKGGTDELPLPRIKLVLNLTTPCSTLSKDIGGGRLALGTGNLLVGYYGIRLVAAAAGADFVFRCTEPFDGRAAGEVMPWLQGYFPAPEIGGRHRPKFSPFDPPLPTFKGACHGMGYSPLHYMADAIRSDLRAMAVRLVGRPTWVPQRVPQRAKDGSAPLDFGTSRAAERGADALGKQVERVHGNNFPEPLLPDVEIDDVAIHLRCGDLINGMNTDAYGFLKFQVYADLISPESRSIGIVTTSFDERRTRSKDRGTTQKCRRVVLALVGYLTEHFPRAEVTVRNGPGETQSLAYARLVLAKRTFCSRTTFAVFPAIASFGTSYVQGGAVNYFAGPISEVYDDVVVMDAPFLPSRAVRARGLNGTIEWLLEPARLDLKR